MSILKIWNTLGYQIVLPNNFGKLAFQPKAEMMVKKG